MQDAIGKEIKRSFDAFIVDANRIRDVILDTQASDSGNGGVTSAQLKLLGDTIECAETLMKRLLMAAYFTANYRSCITRTDNPKLDHKVLDRNTEEGAEFGAKLAEKKRKAEAEAAEARPKPCRIGLLEDASEPLGPLDARSASQTKRSRQQQSSPQESLSAFTDDLVERYKALHGLYTNRFNLAGLIPSRSAETRILKRNELLEEVNTFLDKFGLPRVDKNDSIWREWFLRDFIGLDSPSRPVMVQDTPDRREAVYHETLSRITEIAKKALK